MPLTVVEGSTERLDAITGEFGQLVKAQGSAVGEAPFTGHPSATPIDCSDEAAGTAPVVRRSKRRTFSCGEGHVALLVNGFDFSVLFLRKLWE